MFDDALEQKLHAKGAYDPPERKAFVPAKLDDTSEFTPIFETEEIEPDVYQATPSVVEVTVEKFETAYEASIDYSLLTEQIHAPLFKPGDCPIYDQMLTEKLILSGTFTNKDGETEAFERTAFPPHDFEAASVRLENAIGETVEWAASQVRSMWNIIDSHSHWSIESNLEGV